MKKYLLITPWCPYPPHKNGGIHTIYNILLNKPENIDMDLLYFFEKDLLAEEHIKAFVSNIYYEEAFSKPGLALRLKCLLRGIPDQLAGVKVKSKNTTFDFGKYDVIILDQVFSLEFLKQIPKEIPVISMMHDNHILMYRRKSRQDTNWIKKLYDILQCVYFKKYEQARLRNVTKIIYVSEKDAAIAKEIHPYYREKYDDITLGVEIPCNSRINKSNNKYSVVFSGVMDYGPNEDAAVFFGEKVFPKIKERIPMCTFTIAGKNPTPQVQKLDDGESIFVTGFVDDMIDTITQSSVYISPLRYGSGTKNKVLEAMAAGMPVLLSPVSCEGINGLIDEENSIFVDEDEWVEKTIEVLQNEVLQRKIAENGRKYVGDFHSWSTVFEKFII